MPKAKLVKYMDFPSDFGTLTETFEYDPKEHKTAEAAAKAFYAELCRFAKEVYEVDPAIEIWIKNPKEAEAHGYGVNAWWVCWEGGPYDWGVTLSLTSLHNYGSWYTEPYWGFDVCFIQE